MALKQKIDDSDDESGGTETDFFVENSEESDENDDFGELKFSKATSEFSDSSSQNNLQQSQSSDKEKELDQFEIHRVNMLSKYTDFTLKMDVVL